MSDWRSCIVTFVDVIGIKKLANARSTDATSKMRRLHELAGTHINHVMPKHAHAYSWNDSVLLLGYLGDHSSAADLLKEASKLKAAIEGKVGKCYAISVKGQAFPESVPPQASVFDGSQLSQPRSVTIKASSYALTNCFEIEEQLGKKHKASWYLDSRLKEAVCKKPRAVETIALLPGRECREILMFDGNLFDID